MNLVGHLGLQLEDDAVPELLEEHDMEVLYRFDRLHEGEPDEYTSPAREAGFELRRSSHRSRTQRREQRRMVLPTRTKVTLSHTAE